MNSVTRVKELCKERKIPIYKLEKELGYANGYIGQLKKGTFPDDRLVEIANYLGVTAEFLLTGETKKETLTASGERKDIHIGQAIKEETLSPQERELLRKFRRLDPRGQAAVWNVLDFEYNSLPGEQSGAAAKNA